jgi:hypothetical protein
MDSLPLAWPPKPKRMADSVFSPNVCCLRERKRANNADESASAATASSIAARHGQAGLPRVITGHYLAIQEEDNLKIHDCLLLLPIVKDVEGNGNKCCIAAAGFKAAPTS